MLYSSDLSDSQWELIKDIFSTKKRYSHKYSKRNLINAVFYIVKTGCQWRMLPKDFPDWRAVYNFYDRAKNKGLWEIMMQKLVTVNQKKLSVDLKYGIIDSQTTKSHNKCKDSGYNGGMRKPGGLSQEHIDKFVIWRK